MKAQWQRGMKPLTCSIETAKQVSEIKSTVEKLEKLLGGQLSGINNLYKRFSDAYYILQTFSRALKMPIKK